MNMNDRNLKPDTPEFQTELVLILAEMCRQLLARRRQKLVETTGNSKLKNLPEK